MDILAIAPSIRRKQGGSIAVPNFAGFQGTLSYAANNAKSGVKLKLINSGGNNTFKAPTKPKSPAILFLGVQISGKAKVTFKSDSAQASIRSSKLVAGRSYTLDLYKGKKRVGTIAAGTPSAKGVLQFRTPLAKIAIAPSVPLVLKLTYMPATAPVASPTALTFSSAASQTFKVQESHYTGALTAKSSDTTIATVAPNSQTGPNATFTVTPVGAGRCKVTVTDSRGKKATVSVTVDGGVIIIDRAPVATPSSLAFENATPQTFDVKETNYTGAFSVSGCDAIAGVSPSSAGGPDATFTVTPVGVGTCQITIADDQANSATVDVSVSGGSIIINSKPGRPPVP